MLYLALEDDYRRLQERLYRMFGTAESDRLYFSIKANQIGKGLDEQLAGFIGKHKDTSLIIIDTLQKIREIGSDAYSYASDYEVITKLKGYVDELLKSARENSKTIIGILYDTTEENECWSFIPSDNGEYSVVLCNIFGRRLNDRKRIKSRRIAAERLPEIIKIIEDILTDDGFLKTTDYEGRCGNCHSRIGDNDLYCRLCGTKRGEGTFEPYANLIACVYGPPIKTVFKCNACGHSWEITVLGGDKSKFCPQRGKETVRAVEEIGLDFDEKTVLFKREYPEQETEKGDDK